MRAGPLAGSRCPSRGFREGEVGQVPENNAQVGGEGRERQHGPNFQQLEPLLIRGCRAVTE